MGSTVESIQGGLGRTLLAAQPQRMVLGQSPSRWTEGANTLTAAATAAGGTGGTGISGAVIITLDSAPPSVVISSTSGGNGGTVNTRTLSYTAIFDEAVSGFDTNDITVIGSASVGSPAVTRFSASADNRTYTFNVVATNDGSVTVSIAAGVAQDIAGNGNVASNNYALTIDSTAPSIFISTRTPQTVNTALFTLTGTADADSVVDVRKDGTFYWHRNRNGWCLDVPRHAG